MRGRWRRGARLRAKPYTAALAVECAGRSACQWRVARAMACVRARAPGRGARGAMCPVAASLSRARDRAPPSPSLDSGSVRCFLMTARFTDLSLFFTFERMDFAILPGC